VVGERLEEQLAQVGGQGGVDHHVDRGDAPLGRQVGLDAPQMGLNCVFVTAPPMPFVPEDLQMRPIVAVIACHVGDEAEGARLLQPVRDLRPAFDVIGPVPYTAVQQMLDLSAPAGRRS